MRSGQLRRLRQLAGQFTLEESVSMDPKINLYIEQKIENLPKRKQMLILDVLDAIVQSGKNGINAQNWVNHIKSLHTDLPASGDESPVELIKQTIKMFDKHVKKIGKGQWQWVEDDLDVSPEVMQTVQATVDVVNKAVELMSNATQGMSMKEWADALQKAFPMLPPTGHFSANEFVNRIYDQLSGSFDKKGDKLIWKTQPKTQVDFQKWTDPEQMKKFKD